MDIWSLINPIVRAFFYLSSIGAVGTILFALHFSKYQSSAGVYYCQSLAHKSAMLGVVTSLGIFLSVSGNMGGDFISVFDKIMLQHAFESKSGLASLIAVLGFVLILNTGKSSSLLGLVVSLFGSALVLSSFVIIGHSTKEGILTQSLLLMHLVGIVYWLGSLMPLRWMCLSDGEENLHFIAHRFGVLAIGYIGTSVIAGFAFAYTLLGGVSALIDSSYGNVLLAKLMAVSLVLSFGALNKFRLVPSIIDNAALGAKRLRSSMNIELLLVLFILICSSLLTTSLTLPMR